MTTLATSALSWALAWAILGPGDDLQGVVERAESHFVAEEYDEASEAFAEAYALDPDPVFLYARAQAERLRGDCVAAIELYERFLKANPPEPASTEAALNRDRCLESVERESIAPVVTEAPSDDGDQQTGAAPPPRSKAPWGYALLGAGAVSAGIGGGLWGIAIANDRDAPGSRTEDDFVDQKSKARTRHHAGIAVVSLGGALLVAGAIQLIVTHTRRRSRKTSATMSFDRHAVGFGVSGRF